MPVTDSDFYLSLMSSDSSSEFPENKLSFFINRLARKIILSEQYDWLVGVYQINHQKVVSGPSNVMPKRSASKKDTNVDENFLKNTLNSDINENSELLNINVPKKMVTSAENTLKKPPSSDDDEIVFKSPANNDLNMESVEDLASKMLKDSVNPNIYTAEYFKIYTSSESTFSYNYSSTRHPNTTTEITFSNLDDVIDKEPTISVVIPMHSYKNLSPLYKDPTLKISVEKSYTGKQLMEKFLFAMFKVLRGTLPQNMITATFGPLESDYAAYVNSRAQFLIKAARLFVSMIVKANDLHRHNIQKREVGKKSNFEMIYLDIIQPRFFGGSLNKIVYTFPIELDIVVNQTPSKISYFRLNSREFSEISVILLDENGDLLNIQSGTFSTHVGLHFKRVLN